jgi:lipopolysaccharide/colanic/teichoic acid biosynthesis glycosyltransferase
MMNTPAVGSRGADTVYRRYGKAVLDRTLAALLLMPLGPIIAIVAVCALWLQGRPVLFRQVRPGLREQPFELLKFRTMTSERGHGGALLSDGDRLTTFGRWLRRTSLDELPQLINVLRGELSLVGPRPLLVEYLPRYSAEQRRRHEVRPGITGLAQVSGRNALDWATRLRLDVEYVERYSFRLDSWILARTLSKVVTGEGIADGRTPTSEPFTGQR